MDLSLTCRTCGGIADPGISLLCPTRQALANWVKRRIPNFKLDDDLPKRLCRNCVEQIKLHIEFRGQYFKSQKLLTNNIHMDTSQASSSSQETREEKENENLPSTSDQKNTTQDQILSPSIQEPVNKNICLSQKDKDLIKNYNIKDLKIHINKLTEEEIKRHTVVIRAEENEVETVHVKNKPGPKQTKIKTIAEIKTEPLDNDDIDELDNIPLIFRRVSKIQPEFISVEIEDKEKDSIEENAKGIKIPDVEDKETDQKPTSQLGHKKPSSQSGHKPRSKKGRKRKAQDNIVGTEETTSLTKSVKPNFAAEIKSDSIINMKSDSVPEIKTSSVTEIKTNPLTDTQTNSVAKIKTSPAVNTKTKSATEIKTSPVTITKINSVTEIKMNPAPVVKIPKKRGRKPKIRPELSINIPEVRNIEMTVPTLENCTINETSLDIPSQNTTQQEQIQQEFVPKSPSKLPVQKIIWPSSSNQNNNPPSAVVPPFNLLSSLEENKQISSVTTNTSDTIMDENTNESDDTIVAPDFSNEQEEMSTQTSPILDEENTQDTSSQNNSQDSQITSEENSTTVSLPQVSPVSNLTQCINTTENSNNTNSDMNNIIENSNNSYQNEQSINNYNTTDFQTDNTVNNFNNKIDNTQNLATIMQIQNAFIDPLPSLPLYNNQSFTPGSIQSCYVNSAQSDVQNTSSTYVQDISTHTPSMNYNPTTISVENNPAYVPLTLNPPPRQSTFNYNPPVQQTSLPISQSTYVAPTSTKDKKYLTVKIKKPRKPRTTKPRTTSVASNIDINPSIIPPTNKSFSYAATSNPNTDLSQHQSSNIVMNSSIIPPVSKSFSYPTSNPNIDISQQEEHSQVSTPDIYSNLHPQPVISHDQTSFSSNTEGNPFTSVETNSSNVTSYQINPRNVYYNQQYSYIPSTESTQYSETQTPSNSQSSDETSVVNSIPDPQMSYAQPLIQNTNPTYNQQMIPFMSSSSSSQPANSVYVSPQHCYINPHNFASQNHLMYQTSHPAQSYYTPVVQQQELQPTSIHPIQTPIPMYAYQNPSNVMLSNINPGQSVSMFPNNTPASYDQSNPNVPHNNMYYYVNSYNNMQ